jgi:hypothetical protein
MAFKPAETFQGVVDFTNIDASAARTVTVGLIVRGIDTASGQGAGEFIYLPGVASLAVGSVVTYNPLKPSVTLAPHTANLDSPLAVAMSANTAATSYGWYQISGVATISRITGAKTSPSVPLYLSATAGSVQSVASAGKQLVNCITVNAATVASATTTIQALINRPFAQGAIT